MNKQDIIARLQAAHIDTAAYDAKIILEDVAPEHIAQVVARRVGGEPLWRILGYRDFWKHRFYLAPETLEPRPDTETLIETVLSSFPPLTPTLSREGRGGETPKRILDMGTGTGCILLSLLHEYPDATGVGVDIQDGALATARGNAERLNLTNRATFTVSNWCDSVDGVFDVIVSNPPYIPTRDIANLESNVKNFDPILALDGGNDGLDPYKKLLPACKKRLVRGGRLFFEIGMGQVDDITRLVAENSATLIRVVRDLNGVERVVEIGYGDN